MKIKLRGFLTLLFALFIQISFAQNKTITGTITDEAGLPLPGVNIIIKGTSSGVQSDIDGKYSISANAGDTLVFSYLGFATQSIVVKDSNTINVSLAEDASVLDEVVITALGLEKKKDDDLSSTSIVKVDQLKKSGEAGVLQALSGKTSGVNITRNSGDPGAGAYIQIRGKIPY